MRLVLSNGLFPQQDSPSARPAARFRLILLLIGLIARWRWPMCMALLLLWFFPLGLVSQGLWRWLEALWQRRAATAAPRADAIVVLTGGASPFRPGQVSEGQRHLQEARQLGIPAAAMASTPPVMNTADEAVAIRRLLSPPS